MGNVAILRALLLASLQPHASAAPTSAIQSADAASSCDDIQAVLDVHNKERKQWGAATLKWSVLQAFPAFLQLPL